MDGSVDAEGRVLQCRIWWPQNLCCHKFRRIALLGWANRHENCIECVVASAVAMDENVPLACQSTSLQELLRLAMEGLPKNLGEFCILGECHSLNEITTLNVTDKALPTHVYESCEAKPLQGRKGSLYLDDREHDNSGTRFTWGTEVCRAYHDINLAMKLDPLLGMLVKNGGNDSQCFAKVADMQCANGAGIWLHLSACFADCNYRHEHCIPMLRGLQLGHTALLANSHVIVYEQPCFGSHDFSLEKQRFRCLCVKHDHVTQQQSSTCKEPQWMVEFQQQRYTLGMETVILQLNCSAAAQNKIDTLMHPNLAPHKQNRSSILFNNLLRLLAVAVAVGATVLFVLAKLVLYIMGKFTMSLPGAHSFVNASNAYHILCYRCKEFLVWPVILSWGGKGPTHPNVFLAHQISLMKHHVWSAIVFDMIFGAFSGGLLLVYHGRIMQLLYFVSQFLTNDILRTGCIWLMGVPAGFKLNNELAGMFGTVALNVIQMWSTLWCFCKPVLGCCITVLSVIGMLLGATMSVAIVLDLLSLATIHLFVLYQATAFIYSIQLQTLAALWRLFRGQKYNPLRTRIDSYNYTVEQLVVASLMFTPLLLLLPTTSVFYTFFTIIFTSVSLFRFLLQLLIAILSSFPYIEIGMWCFKPRRFSYGIWFQSMYLCENGKPWNSTVAYFNYHNIGISNAFVNSKASSSNNDVNANQNSNSYGGTKDLLVQDDLQAQQFNLVSILGSNMASLGILLHPFVEQLRSVLSQLSIVDILYKMASGGRLPQRLSLGTRRPLPQSTLTLKRFWRLCFDSIAISS